MGVLSRETREEGFSLVEVLVAMGILAVSLLSLAGVFTMALARSTSASSDIIAKEQATQAIEAIFAARDSGRLQWAQLQNDTTSPGVFKTGFQNLVNTGADRIPNTADDGDDTTIMTIRKPGPDGNLGNSDDQIVSLKNFQRQVTITNSTTSADTLRQITVTIQYTVSGVTRSFRMTSYISSYGS
jgi:prepilin-type N-terminal cleavage/methylation domain-containing protein